MRAGSRHGTWAAATRENTGSSIFKRDKLEIPGKVVGIEYDPNRSANIALIHYGDGEKRYILAPLGMKVGEIMVASRKLIRR